MFGPTDNEWIKTEIYLMNGRTETEEIPLFRLTLGQCKINSRWPTWLLLPRCKDGLISLEITIFPLTFRRFSGDVEAAGGGLTSYLFSHFQKLKDKRRVRQVSVPWPFLLGRGKLPFSPLQNRDVSLFSVRRLGTERDRESRLWPMRRGKGDFFFPPNKSDRVR